MKLYLVLFVTLALFSPLNSFAFNSRRCAKVFPGGGKGLGKTEKIYYKLFSVSTFSSQFLTSTGDCRLIGGVSEDERKFFVADNAAQLKGDIVRAEGDYLAAAAFLYGCSSSEQDKVFLRLQENLTKVFGSDLNHDPRRVADEFDQLMGSDLKLRRICSLGA